MGRLALRCAAVATALTAISTVLLWLLPQLTPASIPQAQLYLRPEYMGRLWVNLIHVVLALFGYAAAASLWARRSVTFAAIGAVAFGFWALLEAIGVSVNIFAVNGAWRPALAAGPTPQLEASLAWFPAWWDAVFFLLLVCFLVGTTALGAVASAGRGLERLVGVLMLLGAPLTLVIMAEGYFGFAAGGPLDDWIYPALQPVSRLLLGLWLWREAARRPG